MLAVTAYAWVWGCNELRLSGNASVPVKVYAPGRGWTTYYLRKTGRPPVLLCLVLADLINIPHDSTAATIIMEHTLAVDGFKLPGTLEPLSLEFDQYSELCPDDRNPVWPGLC
jgi:hypothetical protein